MSFDELEDRIFPWIKAVEPDSADGRAGGITDENGEVAADIVVMDFMADLVITFAVDEGEYFSLLRRGDMPENMTVDALYTLGKKNLSEQVEFNLTGTNYGGFGILAGGDHEAGALCLDFIWDAVVKQAGENLVIAVPAKDCLFMALASDPGQVDAMSELSKDIFENGERILTRTLFLFDAGTREFSVYGQF